jgi:hypothetical protein
LLGEKEFAEAWNPPYQRGTERETTVVVAPSGGCVTSSGRPTAFVKGKFLSNEGPQRGMKTPFQTADESRDDDDVPKFRHAAEISAQHQIHHNE